jgi:hypothetical protein
MAPLLCITGGKKKSGTQKLAFMLPNHCIVYNDVFLRNILTIITLTRPKYELPDDDHRPKHVGVF